MASPENKPTRTRRVLLLTIVITTLATIAVGGLLINIFERQQEAREPFFRVVELGDNTTDPQR
jgi:nitrite reductase (cytochrome c-552)